uniref:Uncharacterized protein n=1 Tax=Oryza glumipatula TaxID=40148 RepID=A0A0E0BIS2_9ORYZ
MRWPSSGGWQRLRRRHCFGPRCWTLGSTLTSKEVFTWANSNNQRLLHMMDGCYCETSSSSLYHTLHPTMIPPSTSARHPVALSTTSHKTQTVIFILMFDSHVWHHMIWRHSCE